MTNKTDLHAHTTASEDPPLASQTVIETITMIPPMSAKVPGRSPSKIITQTGLSRGSAALNSEQASGGQS